MTAPADAEHSTRRSWRRLEIRHVLPFVPLVLLAIAAVHPIVDNSFLWHVRAGAAQLDAGRVLVTDPFSFTMGGAAWRTQSWLAELLYGTLERLTGGIGWTPWMVFAATAATLLLAGLAIARVTRNVVATAMWTMVLAWLAVPFAQPRPVVLSYVFLAAVVVALTDEERLGWAIVPLVWVWAGVHGSWIMGPGLVLLEAVRRRSRRLALLAVAGVVVASFTAHGLGVWQILRDFLVNRDALALLNEWQPPAFADPVQAPYLIVILGVLVAGVRGRLRVRDLVVVVPFLFFGLTTRRAVYPAAIVLVPVASSAWVPGPWTTRRSSSAFVAWAVAALLTATLVAVLGINRTSLDPSRFPDAATLAAVGSQPFFHDDTVGGYLIYARWPAERVLIDDRAELYGRSFFERYLRATRGDYEDLFADYGIRAVLARAKWTLVDVLQRDGWRVSHRDDEFVVLRAP